MKLAIIRNVLPPWCRNSWTTMEHERSIQRIWGKETRWSARCWTTRWNERTPSLIWVTIVHKTGRWSNRTCRSLPAKIKDWDCHRCQRIVLKGTARLQSQFRGASTWWPPQPRRVKSPMHTVRAESRHSMSTSFWVSRARKTTSRTMITRRARIWIVRTIEIIRSCKPVAARAETICRCSALRTHPSQIWTSKTALFYVTWGRTVNFQGKVTCPDSAMTATVG